LTSWRYAAATDTGIVRETNQDAIFVDDTLALVADGMGGHAAGEVASAMAVEFVRDGFHDRPTVEGLYSAIEEANRAILADARDNPARFGMGTTVVAVGLTRDDAGVRSPTLFNVGDSRAYQLRDGALRQLSEDHSVAEEWVRMGRLTSEEALVHPRRHQLTRALGVDDELEIDVLSLNALPGDRLMLCSDGLSNELSADVLADLASAPTPLDEAVTRMVSAAKQSGGRDNISVILLEFVDVHVATTPIKKTVSSASPPVAPGPLTNSNRASHHRRRFTWRVFASVAVFALVIAGSVAVVHWYAYSTFYLDNDAGTIAVYQGQPNGVLWFKPVKVLDTPNRTSQLRPVDQRALSATISEPSLASARRYANYLHNVWQMGRPSSSTTTTTTTVRTTATTTVATTKG
jgi:serine/threonine protein phosphatase PrpC